MSKRIHRIFASYINLISRHLVLSLIIILAVTAVAIFTASQLTIKSDLKELLPENYQSVKQLNKMLERIGGTGSLIVVAESPDFEANKKFMDALAAELNKLPPKKIRYLDYKSDEIKKFYENYFLYYLNIEDIDRLYKSIKRRIDYEKLSFTQLFIDFSDEDPLLSEIEDIKEDNRKNYAAPVNTVENYYGGEWGRMLIMIIRPYGASLTVDNARNLIKSVKKKVSEINPASFDPKMKVGYCGNVVSTVEEYDTLKKDILSTAILCICLVSLVIIIYFLRFRIVFLIGTNLLIALSWTFALTYFFIGYLNTQTAFLGSIIIGTGINYGIIVMARYVEERRKAKEHAKAMISALEHTLSSTFLAAATTSVAFSVLLIANIRGLSQFGIIGAMGIMLCWISTMLVLPVLTLISEKIKNMVKYHDRPRRRSALFIILTRLVVNSPRKIVIVSVILALISIGLIVNFAPDSIEYDFTKMRNKTSVSSGTEALEKRVSKLFKHSMTPAVVIAEDITDAPKICNAVKKKNRAIPKKDRRVGSCYSIYSLLPERQAEKIDKLRDLKLLLDRNEEHIDDIEGELNDKIEEIKKSLSGHFISIDDLPYSLTKHFEDLNKERGIVVFINPRPGMELSDGRNLIRFANTIEKLELPDGREFHAAGASLIFSDLVKTIRRDAPTITLASFIAVLIFIAIVVRKWRASWIIVGSIACAIIIMCGLISLFRIKLNFFNFIALPLTFGIGADYAINITLRLARDQMSDIETGLRNTGGAVILCSSTTIIGYSVLMIANNQALASFGTLAIIGEFACISSAILLAPAVMYMKRNSINRSK